MPAVRSSTGAIMRVCCSQGIAQALGMLRASEPDGTALEARGLVFHVSAARPYPLLPRTFYWARQPDLGPPEP